MADTRKCTPAMRAGRLSKANQFLTAAELIAASIEDSDLADAFVTLCVHAGIAAADVICCAKLNEHSTGGNHKTAVAFLARVDPANSVHLATLLGMKGHAGYSAVPSTAKYQESARAAAQALVEAAKLA